MADSQKLQVLKAFTVLLQGITPANGYDFDLSQVVFRGRNRFGDSDPKTMVTILEAPRPGGSSYAGESEARSDTWLLLIQGWCPDDKDHPSDPVYGLLDAVEKRLERITAVGVNTGKPNYPSDYLLGGLITKFQSGQGVVRPPTQDVSSSSFFYLPVQVGLARISTS